MHREGTNPENVQPEDVLCDFCHRAVWAMGLPCIEGHHGSVICGDCLKIAWLEIVGMDGGAGQDGRDCTMCLACHDVHVWESPLHPESLICRRCVKMAGVTLRRDGDYEWETPAGPDD